jgi:nucleoside-diphosphate-sugar epimerase
MIKPSFKSAIVTGCAGFIGSHLTNYLLENGVYVLGIDSRHCDIKAHNFEFLRFNLKRKMSDLSRCDVVFHQAAFNHIGTSILNPDSYLKNNISSTVNVLEYCMRHKEAVPLVWASSSSVYNSLPSPYSLSKRVCEQITEMYNNLYQSNAIGLRYHNVFGKGQSPKAVFPIWIDAIKNSDPIILKGENVSRDFTHVDNVTHANICAANTALEKPLIGCVDIGCGQSISIEYALTLILKHFDLEFTNVNLIRKSLGANELLKSKASIDYTRLSIGYEPVTFFESGLEKYLNEWQS